MSKFYPRLSKLISSEKLPAFFSGVTNIFDKLYFRNFQTVKSLDGVTVSYVIELISYKELKIDIAGSGFSLLLNPDFESDGVSAFPLSLNTRWGIRKYMLQGRDPFNNYILLRKLSFSPNSNARIHLDYVLESKFLPWVKIKLTTSISNIKLKY
jgi:hypothetical protein